MLESDKTTAAADLWEAVKESGFTALGLTTEFSYNANDNLALVPYVRYSDIMDKKLESAVVDPELFYGGIRFDFSF